MNNSSKYLMLLMLAILLLVAPVEAWEIPNISQTEEAVMSDVKLLLRATSAVGWKKGKKGDLWAITPGDYGTAEVAPDWVQLTVTDVPGTQAEAIALMHQYLESLATGFDYTEVAGAAVGEQRYRVAAHAELGAIPNPIFLAIRNGVTARFATTGAHESQQPRRWFEFDGDEGIPLDELGYQAEKSAEDSRRYTMGDNYVDNLPSVPAGTPISDTQTWTWLELNIQDKLD